jgi:hypothetical protein
VEEALASDLLPLDSEFRKLDPGQQNELISRVIALGSGLVAGAAVTAAGGGSTLPAGIAAGAAVTVTVSQVLSSRGSMEADNLQAAEAVADRQREQAETEIQAIISDVRSGIITPIEGQILYESWITNVRVAEAVLKELNVDPSTGDLARRKQRLADAPDEYSEILNFFDKIEPLFRKELEDAILQTNQRTALVRQQAIDQARGFTAAPETFEPAPRQFRATRSEGPAVPSANPLRGGQ